MKLLKYCLITVMLLFTLSLFAQNYMDTMNTFEGPWRNSEYGKWMATLDFNADGIDDLFVLARSGPPTPSEVHIFWGGNNFEYKNTPDCIIPMTGSDAGYGIFACGDVNGDGYDDITIAGLLMFDSPVPNFHYFRFYYGGPDAELDFTDYDYEYGSLVGPGYYSDREAFSSCLGDVNGDGCDDMGFGLQRESGSRDLGIMVGGTFEIIIVENFLQQLASNIEAMGDLNNDGFADFAVGYLNFSNENITKIYYGDSTLSLTNNNIICNYDLTYDFNGAITVGDMNGDGSPDFLFPTTEENTSDYFGLALWGNSFENSTLYPIQCNPPYSTFIRGSGSFGQWIKHGDFNGNGYSDFVGGNSSYGLWDGTAAIWLGGENPNGIYDLQLMCPLFPEFAGYFGLNVNVGDYNNDG